MSRSTYFKSRLYIRMAECPPVIPTVADALRQHAPADLKKFGKSVSVAQLKVIGAITRCRTGELGGLAYRFGDCGHSHWYGGSSSRSQSLIGFRIPTVRSERFDDQDGCRQM